MAISCSLLLALINCFFCWVCFPEWTWWYTASETALHDKLSKRASCSCFTRILSYLLCCTHTLRIHLASWLLSYGSVWWIGSYMYMYMSFLVISAGVGAHRWLSRYCEACVAESVADCSALVAISTSLTLSLAIFASTVWLLQVSVVSTTTLWVYQQLQALSMQLVTYRATWWVPGRWSPTELGELVHCLSSSSSSTLHLHVTMLIQHAFMM